MPAAAILLGIVLRFSSAFALRWLWIITMGAFLGWLANRFISVSIVHRHPLRGIGNQILAVNRGIERTLDVQVIAAEGAFVTLCMGAGHQLERIGFDLAGFAMAAAHAVTGIRMQMPKIGLLLARVTAAGLLIALIANQIRKMVIALHGQAAHTNKLDQIYRARLRALQRGIDRLRTRTIPAINARARALTARVGRLERRLTGEIRARGRVVAGAGTVVGAAAVTAALAKLGLSWLRCPSLGRLGKRVGCNGFAFLEALMFLPLTAIGLREMCSLVRPIQQIALQFEPVLIAFVSEVEGFVCGGRQAAPTGIVDSDFATVSRYPSGIVASDID